jgi:hypothetical protein
MVVVRRAGQIFLAGPFLPMTAAIAEAGVTF